MTDAPQSRRVAAIGDEEFTIGFHLAGVTRTRNTRDADEYAEAMEDLLEDPEVAIIVTRSKLVNELPRVLKDRVTESVDPVVIQMGAGASAGLREKVRNAIGIDLLADQDQN